MLLILAGFVFGFLLFLGFSLVVFSSQGFVLGFWLGYLCILRGASRSPCVPRGTLRFFDIYNFTYQKKNYGRKGPANSIFAM